jgi:mono/diheme cytochrome c family protein
MKKMGNHNSISRTIIFCLAFTLTFSLTSFSQQAAAPAPAADPAATMAAAPATSGGDPVAGKALFNTNCAACHKLDAKATGPALRGVANKYDMAWLYKWINNSSALIASGDAKAVKVFEENNKSVMTAFPQLSTTDIDNIIAYTSEKKAEVAVTGGVDPTVKGGGESGVSNNVILGALSLVMLMLVVMLFLVNNVLTKIAKSNGIEGVDRKVDFLALPKAFVKNQFLVFVSAVFLLLASGYFVYGYLSQIGVDQDYAPIQPIHYSHRIHAGSNGIDCKYCHSSARTSKNAGIPSLNVCMNCHKNISEVADTTATAEYSKAFYDAQIQKLYDAVGWDKSTQKYTGKTQPVKWVRIHKLPDFAYFNHSQHVTVGGIECQKCHGPVQEYEIQKQFAPLTMGWCINCHRETNVKMEGNAYYDKIHAELSKKYGKDKLTVSDMGGLECGKCHY